MTKRICCIGSLLAIAVTAAEAPGFTDTGRRAKLAKAFPGIDRIFLDYQKTRNIPGLVYGVVIDGDLAHVKAWGVQDLKTKDPVTANTVFRIASMTKSFTALAILKLRDEGKLSLDDPVARFIPQFERMTLATRDAAPIRIRQFLTHGAGFPEDNPWGDRQLGQSDKTLDEWLADGIPFSTSPDTAYEYSNYGFALLGRIVAKASGVSYREYLEKEILAPLGMRNSTLEASAVRREVRAQGYKLVDGSLVEEPSLPHGSFGAMGGLLTSAHDLARYIAYQLSAFPPRDEAETGPVRRASQREMQRVWRTNSLSAGRASPGTPLRAVAGGYGYGLGVQQDCHFDQMVGHGGGLPGFGSYMMWLPDYGVGVFAMANLTYTGPGALMPSVFEALRNTGGLERRKLAPSKELTRTRDAIVKLWRVWNDADAQAIAAGNLFLDQPAAARRARFEELKAQLGECRDPSAINQENLLRGSFEMACSKGRAEFTFTLAPAQPPRVQYLRVAAVMQPAKDARDVAGALASGKNLRSIAGRTLDLDSLEKEIERLRTAYGACRVEQAVAGDGVRDVTMRFQCDRGSLDVRMQLEGGKLARAGFTRPPGVLCAP